MILTKKKFTNSVEETGQAQLFVENPNNWIDQLLSLRSQYKTEYGL